MQWTNLEGAVPKAMGLMAETSQWARESAVNHEKQKEILTIGKPVEILFGLHHCMFPKYFRAV